MTIDVSVCNGDIAKMLVEFAYSQELVIDLDSVCDLAVAADYFGFLTAVDHCTKTIQSQLNNEN